MPKCWGHRGASADYPENTLASFESAARAGVHGIESDVHITSDDYILMFHDPELGRTTIGGSGSINTQPYKGNIENLVTSKKPEQKIPTFRETIAWLNKPENQHLEFNIDVKPNNDPTRLFTLMHEVLSSQPDWETTLAPRIILGLWHPKFIAPALTILPQVQRCFIGIDIYLAQRPAFWDSMHAYSIAFPMLASSEGQKFRERCRKEGKKVYTWTCNSQEQWAMAAKWELDVVMTDTPIPYMLERAKVFQLKKPIVPRDPWFMWKSLWYYPFVGWLARQLVWRRLERFGGPIAPYLGIKI
ncbi:PLC-like phosphodiesterase [Clavulina sp. PMI_390]|nr:PLC-like phosphodiesterase [Clavulina sp. PMI_390]